MPGSGWWVRCTSSTSRSALRPVRRRRRVDRHVEVVERHVEAAQPGDDRAVDRGQRRDVVAALVDGTSPMPSRRASAAARSAIARKPASEIRWSESGSAAWPSWPAETSSSPGRNASIDRQRDAVERLQVLGVARAGRHREIDRGSRPVAPADLVQPAGPGIQRPLVQRHEQHRRVLPVDVLRPVAVVDVPVEDRHPLDAVLRLRVAGRDRRRG